MSTEPMVIRARWLPTPSELAERLGVDPVNVGVIREPVGDLDGCVDVNLSGTLTRLSMVLDPSSRWPPRRKPKGYTITLPYKYRERWERREHERAEAARRGEVEARHFAAAARLTASASRMERGATPAWVVAARAVDAERRRRGLAPRALVASALGLDDGPVPEHLKRHASIGTCACCTMMTNGEELCPSCSGDLLIEEAR